MKATKLPIPVNQDAKDEYLEMIKDADKFTEFPVLNHNPFIVDVSRSLKTKFKSDGVVKAGRTSLINEETGEVVDDVHFYGQRKVVDTETFVKIFSGRLKDIFDLSKTAVNVLLYIIDSIQKPMNINRDVVYLDIEDIGNWCGYSAKSTAYQGLVELMKAGMIAKYKKRNFYYIDPSLIFNGNRVLIYDEYIRKEADYFDDKSLKK